MQKLQTYNWNDERSTDWVGRHLDGYLPARVIADYGRQYKVAIPKPIVAQLSGAMAHKLTAVNMPKIGDWVAIELNDDGTAIIQLVLPRTSEIIRGNAGKLLDKQVIAANVDLVFIIQSLDSDFSPQRLERYLFQLVAQNIAVVILLNKADQSKDALEKQSQLNYLNVKTIALSVLYDDDISAVEQLIKPGKTIAILGSSGAGKSTLTNRLLGRQAQSTQAVRENDSRGRHTTVHRELFVLPGGGLIIDTPGIRELQLWGDINDLDVSFPEIKTAITNCHYPNCSHDTETGCAIKSGLADGTIDIKRYTTYQNFKSELKALDDRRGFITDRRAQQSRESAKRRRSRIIRDDKLKDLNY